MSQSSEFSLPSYHDAYSRRIYFRLQHSDSRGMSSSILLGKTKCGYRYTMCRDRIHSRGGQISASSCSLVTLISVPRQSFVYYSRLTRRLPRNIIVPLPSKLRIQAFDVTFKIYRWTCTTTAMTLYALLLFTAVRTSSQEIKDEEM